MKLLHEDLTHKIRHCIFEVRNQIGAGFDEETYHQGLLLAFERNGLPFVSKEKRDLTHRNVFIRSFINDFLLDDKVLLSVKCVPCKFLQAHYVQLFSELKLWKKDLGLIVNFGLPDLDIERYAFTEKNPTFVENFDYIKNHTDEQTKEIFEKIRTAIKAVATLHKPGYGKVVWRKLVAAEMSHMQLFYSPNTIVPVQFAGKTIRSYRLRHLIVEDKIVLMIVALQKTIDQSEIASMQSYLKALKLPAGIIVNFGKSEVHVSGVRPA